MKKKTLFSVLAALVLAMSLITGCGGASDESSSAPVTSQDTSSETTSEKEETTTTTAETTTEETTTEEATTTTTEETTEKAADTTEINVGVLKGPTGMGAIKLMDDSENGVYENYHFTLTAEPTDIVARLSNGDLDIGALPTNVAANLYNKTGGKVKLIGINCLGVLQILENGDTVNSIADLKGRTLYCNGKGSNPEYVINYVLRQNGLEPGTDVTVSFDDPSVISQKMISGEIDLCMLPVPAATAIQMKSENARKALDMTVEFRNAANDGSELTMGCLAARAEFIEEHPEAVAEFLKNYEASMTEALNDMDAMAELIAKYEITGNAQIAKKAIPDASIVCITGEDMQKTLEGYFKVLYDADPTSVGGEMPADDFYYVAK